jgi:hypothetical protein
MFELLISTDDNKLYQPSVLDGVKWDTQRKGYPGKLTFSIVNDGVANFQEGNHVRFKTDNTNVFYGFIFKKERNKENIINITAYDQLRYLKNKTIFKYTNKTANELIQMIANDFNLNIGTLEDTKFKIASKLEDGITLWDIILNALDITFDNTGKMYVLYDDFGKLTLKDIESMRVNLLIDEETAENFNYTSSIDGETYNQIVLKRDNEKTGQREVYPINDVNNIKKWGVLQYYKTIDDKVNMKNMADTLLKLYNKKSSNFSISNAFGDVRVRGGSFVLVKLKLDDVKIQNWMLVEQAQHTFGKDEHTMDLTLRGGELN